MTRGPKGIYHDCMFSSVKLVHVGVWFALAAAPGLVACKGQARSFCEAKIQCEGGNDADIDACAIDLGAAEDTAAAYDCANAFTREADCVERSGTCDAGKYRNSCDDEDDSVEACIEAASDRR